MRIKPANEATYQGEKWAEIEQYVISTKKTRECSSPMSTDHLGHYTGNKKVQASPKTAELLLDIQDTVRAMSIQVPSSSPHTPRIWSQSLALILWRLSHSLDTNLLYLAVSIRPSHCPRKFVFSWRLGQSCRLDWHPQSAYAIWSCRLERIWSCTIRLP